MVLQPGASINLPEEYSERAAYIVNGSIEMNRHSYAPGQMLVFHKGEERSMRAKELTTLMLLGGEPLGQRFIWWNFVASSRERIEQAKEDWKQGRIILPPNDDEVFIPLPNDRSGPAGTAPNPEPLS